MKVFLLVLLTGVCLSLDKENISVTEGEMVALHCKHSSNETGWKSEAGQIYLHNMTAAEQRRRDLLLHGKHLVILRASRSHQGNYSCSGRGARIQSWFMLNVTRENENVYPMICFKQEFCSLSCPDSNIPPENALNSTSIIWQKPDGGYEHSPEFLISSVEETHRGNYTCSRSYRDRHQMYNMTFRLDVKVNPQIPRKHVKIIEPKDKEVFYVDIDAPKVIDCTVVDYSEMDDLDWIDVEKNDNLLVFYNVTGDVVEKKMTASLVFRKVSEQDLAKTYTCKFESSSQSSSSVSITLRRKARRSYFSLVVCSVCIVCVMAVPVVVYAKFKVDITLFLRDTLGCHCSVSDGKCYDVFLMSYKSETEGELNSRDRKMLEHVLEETFGYSLCLFDRDVLPGASIAEAVLECVEQSRTVVLVPTSPDPGLESGLMSALHAAFVERQTHLVFVTTEKTGALSAGSIPEALQLLSASGDRVIWKGSSSAIPSSAFWKQLRYYLPAPHRPPKSKLLLPTIQDDSWWGKV